MDSLSQYFKLYNRKYWTQLCLTGGFADEDSANTEINDYFIPGNAHIQQSDIPAAHQLGYIGLVIGAAHATKRMPLSKLTELVASIDHPIILLGGKEDQAQGEILAALDPIKIYNACGKFNLNESAGLVEQAKLIISHDTGLMHIAAAFHKPIISS